MNKRDIQSWLSEGAFKRLCLAILISTLLHLILIGKVSYLSLPKGDFSSHLIEARLTPLPQKTEKLAAKKDVVVPKKTPPKKTSVKKTEQAEPKLQPDSPDTEVLEKLPPPYVPPEVPVTPPIDEAADSMEADQPAPEVITPADDREEIVSKYAFPEEVKTKPYQHVETVFNLYVNEDQARAGKAAIVYDVLQNKRYALRWEVEATGLLSLFYPDLIQTSSGVIDANGLRPNAYHYQFGNDATKMYAAAFNWSDGVLVLTSAKGEKTESLPNNTQDLLSFMYQFMFMPPLTNMQINMTNGKKLASYDYEFVGEETLQLDFDDVRTYHIQHVKADSDDKTELWLALDYHYIPVKIRKTEKDGTVITQIATTIKTQDQIEETHLP